MFNRLNKRSSLLWICVAMSLALVLGLGSAVLAADESDTPRAPQGTPDNSFVKELQSLFGEQGQSAAQAPADNSGGETRKMTIKGVAPAPDPAYVWTDKTTYRPGDKATLYFSIPRAAYVYLLDVDTVGDIRILFPNRYDRNPYISKPGTTSLPRGGYSFSVSGPAGREYLLLIASNESISYFDNLVNRGGEFPLVDNPNQAISQIRDWVRNTTRWSTFAWNSIDVTVSRAPVPPTPAPIVRNQAPVAAVQASATRVTSGTTVTFTTNGSYDPDGSIRSYSWDFNNDGRTDATGQTVRKAFNDIGTYNVRLTVEDNKGATTSTTIQIVVEAPKTLLEIKTSPNNLNIYIDGSYVGRNSVKQYVGPGSHSVQVNGPNGKVFQTQVTVAAGMKSIDLEVSF